tara:strand:- start:531 stop:746 length:216 start_codon:yes stop_codon:yes gene_type:complete
MRHQKKIMATKNKVNKSLLIIRIFLLAVKMERYKTGARGNAANKRYFSLDFVKLKSSFKKQNPKMARAHER